MLEEDPRSERELLAAIENWLHAIFLCNQRMYDVMLMILRDQNEEFGKGVQKTHQEYDFVTDFPFKMSDDE